MKYAAVHITNPHATALAAAKYKMEEARADYWEYHGDSSEERQRLYEAANRASMEWAIVQEHYDAWEREHAADTGTGNELGTVTIAEDGKTLTATYEVDSFSPFIVYAFVEADEPEIKAIITEPDSPITRADFVMFLWNKVGAPVLDFLMQFTDVSQDAEYTEAIRWAAANKIVLGNGDGTFAPEDALTREEMAVILHRYAQYRGIDVSVGENTNILSYEDAFDISSWAIPAIQWACGAGLMQDEAGYIKPRAAVIRKEAWEMLLAVTEDE